jgi:hypothetical protein
VTERHRRPSIDRRQDAPTVADGAVAAPTVAGLLGGVPLPVDAVVAIAIDAAEVLQRGIHGAIQPGALALDAAGRVTLRTDLAPNPRYRAPEEKQAPPSTRADLHALGRVLFELLAGEPYAAYGEAVPAQRIPVFRRRLVFDRGLSEGDVEALQDALAPLLAIDPERRPADAGRVRRALAAWEARWDVDAGRRTLAEWRAKGPPAPAVVPRVAAVAPAEPVVLEEPATRGGPLVAAALAVLAVAVLGLTVATAPSTQAPAGPVEVMMVEQPERPAPEPVEVAPAAEADVVAPNSYLSTTADLQAKGFATVRAVPEGEPLTCARMTLHYRATGEEAWRSRAMTKRVGRLVGRQDDVAHWLVSLRGVQGSRFEHGLDYYAACAVDGGELRSHDPERPGWLRTGRTEGRQPTGRGNTQWRKDLKQLQ